jgi:hypothetical protein
MCFSHCSTDNNNWTNLRLSDDTDTSLAAVFGSCHAPPPPAMFPLLTTHDTRHDTHTYIGPWWEAQGTAAPQFYYDHCGSFNCSIGCPAPEF